MRARRERSAEASVRFERDWQTIKLHLFATADVVVDGSICDAGHGGGDDDDDDSDSSGYAEKRLENRGKNVIWTFLVRRIRKITKSNFFHLPLTALILVALR